ncbi:uncharacterized protein LOC143024749 [Oratosquilla oratoria]|uniref:uncharacterized protein LOC143024749 n=1 Tax=Oratosquilla oratoria TaxID=337810 RepID=UPI003F75AA8C
MRCSCPRVNHFLCCCSVRTGSLFLASCELLLFTSTLLGMLYSFDFAVTLKKSEAKSVGEGPDPALTDLYIIVIVVSIIIMLLSGLQIYGVLYVSMLLYLLSLL